MEEIKNITKTDPQIRIEINDMLDRYNRLPYNYQPKIGYDSLIQNVIFKEMINIMGTTVTDIDIELKMKTSRIEFLEKEKLI